ncbi:hypothetical protein AAF712_014662, partial [Marasmius tenuissimus]
MSTRGKSKRTAANDVASTLQNSDEVQMESHVPDHPTQSPTLSVGRLAGDTRHPKVSSDVQAGTSWAMETDPGGILGNLGLAPPPPIETLNNFRKRETENLIKVARLLSKLDNSWNSEKQSLGKQAQRHGRLVEEGFTQLKRIQSTLDLVSSQPSRAAPHEKLEYLSSA